MAEIAPPPDIHPTAVLRGEIDLAPGVVVGPYCVLDGRIKIGRDTHLLPHTVVHGTTLIGANCKLGPHAVIGAEPSYRGFDGNVETHLVIEDDVLGREFISLHRATKPGLENATRIGRGTMLMPHVHVGHDCVVGANCTLVNGTMLAGHVTLGDGVLMGGDSGVHQFCRIGRMAVIGGGEIVRLDVVPFAAFRHSGHRAYNVVGVRRSGMPASTVKALRQVFTALHQRKSFVRGIEELRARPDYAGLPPEVKEIADFAAASKRGLHGSAGHGESVG